MSSATKRSMIDGSSEPPKKRRKQGKQSRKSDEKEDADTNGAVNQMLCKSFEKDVCKIPEQWAKELLLFSMSKTTDDNLLWLVTEKLDKLKKRQQLNTKDHCLVCHADFDATKNDDSACTLEHDEDGIMPDNYNGCDGCGDPYCENLIWCSKCDAQGCGEFEEPCYEGEHVTRFEDFQNTGIYNFDTIDQYLNCYGCQKCKQIFSD